MADGITNRFTGRAGDYARHRPGYPPEIVEWMALDCGLREGSVVADIGCGTGIVTKMVLDAGARVVGVEPNGDMRGACGDALGANPHLSLSDGTAEATGLADASVDIVVAAQAMHWFDLDRARAEYRRILRPDGWAVAIWNERRLHGDPFHEAYEALLREHGTDYAAIRQRDIPPEKLRAFLGPTTYRLRVVDNAQEHDFEGLLGRLLSASYVPRPDSPRYPALVAAAREAFDAYALDGKVRIAYQTQWHAGQLR